MQVSRSWQNLWPDNVGVWVNTTLVNYCFWLIIFWHALSLCWNVFLQHQSIHWWRLHALVTCYQSRSPLILAFIQERLLKEFILRTVGLLASKYVNGGYRKTTEYNYVLTWMRHQLLCIRYMFLAIVWSTHIYPQCVLWMYQNVMEQIKKKTNCEFHKAMFRLLTSSTSCV